MKGEWTVLDGSNEWHARGQVDYRKNSQSVIGKVVIITGASSGIGRSTARALSADGARLVLVGRNTERLTSLRGELPGDSVALAIDVTEPEGSKKIVDFTLTEYGQIDVVFANAGIYLQGEVVETEREALRRNIEVNVFAKLALVHAALPHLLKRERGDILVMSSIAGHQSLASEPIYSAAKHAVRAFAQALRHQIAGSGVRVAEIAPGVVLTDLWGYPEGDPRVLDRLDAKTGLLADDVADIIHFVLSRPPHVTIRDLVVLPTNQRI